MYSAMIGIYAPHVVSGAINKGSLINTPVSASGLGPMIFFSLAVVQFWMVSAVDCLPITSHS